MNRWRCQKFFETRHNTENTTGKSTILDFKQECVPVGCALSACYHMGGVSLTETPWSETTPGQRPSLVMWPVVQAGTEIPLWTESDRCKNITLPQTSFAGGNYIAQSCTLLSNACLENVPHSHSLFIYGWFRTDQFDAQNYLAAD